MANFYRAIRPLLFALPPEGAHRLALLALKSLNMAVGYAEGEDHLLKQQIWGRHFANPFGMAAGFDKNGETIGGVLKLGFGFTEIGTLTPLPQAGNARPRLYRLPQYGAIINRLGFNNKGQIEALHRLSVFRARSSGHRRLIGVNIGANKQSPDWFADYEIGAARFAVMADYLTVNISSPNTPNLRDLQAQDPIDILMKKVRMAAPATPILIKLAPDLSPDEACAIAELAVVNKIDGLIVSNTTTSRAGVNGHKFAAQTGGLSGQPLFDKSTSLLAEIYRTSQNKLTLIGVGGVATPEQAYEKICAGASLVQLYTALIYQGPALVGQLRRGLADLLRRDGHHSISTAIGSKI